MTITVLDSRNEYVSAASQTVFNFTFKIFVASDLTVYVTPSGQDSNDVNDLTTDYVVDPGSIGIDAGGFFTFNTPLNAGDKVSIVSDIPLNRTVDYQNNGDFRPDTVNGDNDRQVAQIKQLQEIVNKTVVFNQSSQNTSSLSLPDPAAGLLLRWNALLTGLENIAVSELSSSITTSDRVGFYFASIAEAIASTDADVVKLGAQITIGDRGDSTWEVVSSGSVPDSIFNSPHSVGIPSLAFKLKIKDGIHNAVEFGAVGDDTTDDALPSQAAAVAAVEYSNANVGGATLLFPPLPYFITTPISLLPEGENTLDRYADMRDGIPVGRVENIHIRGYGAKIRSATASFTAGFPGSMMTLVFAPSCSVKGLIFESDTNNKIPEWFDSTNYFNRPVPTITGESGLMCIRSNNLQVQDNQFLHCEGGLTVTDDREFAHLPPDIMLNYRTEISGNYFFNCWTALSITAGATEELLIHHNHLNYTYVKIAQIGDNGRGIQFTNNTCRDISGFVLATNDTIFKDNTFNNLLGGLSFQPGGLGNLAYTYEIRNYKVNGNICYSDHETVVDDGAGTALPQNFIIFNAAATATGAQTVSITDFECSGNNVDIWPKSGNSNGAFLNRTGDALMLFDSPTFTDNTVTMNNNLGVAVAIANNADPSTTTFTGTFNFNDNKFVRTVTGHNAFEFQFMSGTFNGDAVLEFSGNNIRSLGQSRQVLVGNFNKFIAKDNNFTTEEGAGASNATFWTRSVPKIEIDTNEHGKVGSVGNIGYILYFDGIVEGVYDTILDNAVVRVTDNRITSASHTFTSPLSFPASANGFYEFQGNIIRNKAIFADYPTLPGFPSENVCNPSKLAPPAGPVVATGYVVRPINNTGPIGWQWSNTGTWTAFPNF